MQRLFLAPALALSLSLAPLSGTLAQSAATPVAELGAFSVFQNADPAKLLKGEVMTMRGPASDTARDLSVQSCYVVPVPPAKALDALQQWDASRHRELKIFVHGDLPAAPAPGSFAKLASAPDNGSVRALVATTQKRSQEMQISADEAIRYLPKDFGNGKDAMPEGIRTFWSSVLAARAQAFAAGGVGAQPDYGFTGAGIKPASEFATLLKGQEKIRRQFASFLGESGVTGGRPSLKKDLYFELIDVEDEGVLTLGAFSSKPVGSGFQAADVSYYASGGYYVALTLYQMWPVDVNGQPGTVVWRGDLISAASLASLHGMEKLASESAMMKDVSRAVKLLKGDMAGAR